MLNSRTGEKESIGLQMHSQLGDVNPPEAKADSPSVRDLVSHNEQGNVTDLPQAILILQTLDSRKFEIPLTKEETHQYPLWKIVRDFLALALDVQNPQEMYRTYRLILNCTGKVNIVLGNENRFKTLHELSCNKISAVRLLSTSNSTSTILSRLIASDKPMSDECGICTESFSIPVSSDTDEKAYAYGYVLECGHRFCYPCIRQWFNTYRKNINRRERHPPCPTCRNKNNPEHLDSDVIEASARAYNEMMRLRSLGHENVSMDFHKFWYFLKEEQRY